MRFVITATRDGNIISRNSCDNKPDETPEQAGQAAYEALFRDARRGGQSLERDVEFALELFGNHFRNMVIDGVQTGADGAATLVIRGDKLVATPLQVARFNDKGDTGFAAYVEIHSDAWIAERKRDIDQIMSRA